MFTGTGWRVARFGEPGEALELRDMVWEAPSAGRVLIRVSSAGAGYPDRMMVAGHYPLVGAPPFGLGEEAAGEVVAVPEGSSFAVGDRITGITAFQQGWGGYAEYAYVLETSAMRAPDALTDDQAGGFPIAFRTAHAGLVERARLEPGETVVVLGAAGSTGSAAVQFAKACGATVIAVAGGEDKVRFCAEQGADHVVNHRIEGVPARIVEIAEGRGADVAFDPVGGELAGAILPSLARDGRLLLVGQASGAGPSIEPVQLMMGNISVMGVLAFPRQDPAAEAAIWARLATLAAEGALQTPVGNVYGYHDVPRMLVEQVSAAPGKTVVRVG